MTTRLSFLLLIFAFNACNQTKFEEDFFRKPEVTTLLKSCPYYIDEQGWQLTSVEQGDPSIVDENLPDRYILWFVKEELDTSKYLKIRTTKDKAPIAIVSFVKEYAEQDGRIVLEMNASDTLMCYREEGSEKKEFIVGEYYYKFVNRLYNPVELEYYLVHKDSLNKIRGNNLPKIGF